MNINILHRIIILKYDAGWSVLFERKIYFSNIRDLFKSFLSEF